MVQPAVPLLWISIAFLTGILLASMFHLPAWAWITIAVIILILFIVSRFLARRFSIPDSRVILHPYTFILPIFLVPGA
jgi:hypothetical protein